MLDLFLKFWFSFNLSVLLMFILGGLIKKYDVIFCLLLFIEI